VRVLFSFLAMGIFDRFRKPAVDVDAIRAEAVALGRSQALTEVSQALTRAQEINSPLGGIPGIPTFKDQPHAAYQFDQPIVYATPQAPYRRPKSFVSLDTLRQLADTYDPLRACINHLKREVRTMPFKVVAKDDRTVSESRLKAAQFLFAREGGVGGPGVLYRHWEGAAIEDALVIGAVANFHTRSRGGEWLSCDCIDSKTIRPIIDAYGWAPADPSEDAYEQWVYGVLAAKFTRQDLTYDGLHANSFNPYFGSPVEWLVNVINAALYADRWNSSWLTDGSTPSDVYSLPEAWSAEDVMKFAAWWDALKAGDTSGRQKTAFVPGGTKNVGTPSRKDQDFQAYELWLLRRTCSIMGVQPASIGYVGEQYKVSQDASLEQTTQFGAGDLLTLRKALLDDILERAGYDDLEVVDVPHTAEDEGKVAETRGKLIATGQLTINEARQDAGLDPVEGGDVPLVPTTLATLASVTTPVDPTPEPVPVPEPERRVQRKKTSSLDEALDAYRAAMLASEDTAREATAAAWGGAEKRIRESLDALLVRIGELQEVGGAATPAMLAQEERYRVLLQQIEEEMITLAATAGNATSAAQGAGIAATQAALPGVARATMGAAPAGASLPWVELPATAVEALVGFASDGSPLSDLFRAIGPDLSQGATQALVDGIAGGWNPRETASAMDAVLNVGRARAENIARTETMRAMREASRQSYEQNGDVVDGWIWHSALGTRTCPACWAMHGTEHPSSERLAGHQQCFVAGTQVQTHKVLAGVSRWYDGQVLDIRTESGAVLTVTPNHPILTSHGWVAAGLIHEGGDVIRCINSDQTLSSFYPDYDNVPTAIENVVKSFGRSRGVVSSPVEASPEDFHGDGSGSQVYIVRADGALRDALNASRKQPLAHQKLVGGNADLLGLTGKSDLAFVLEALLFATDGIVGGKDISPVLFRCSSCGHELVGDGTAPDLDARSGQSVADHVATDAKGLRNGILGLSGQVAGDDLPLFQMLESGMVATDLVVSVSRRDFSGHVYNLQTATGWYIANGIISHNCRCAMIPKVRSWAEILGDDSIPDDRPEIESGEAEFLRLSEDEQRAILSPGLYHAYASGQVTFRGLAVTVESERWGKSVRPITLKEIDGSADRAAHLRLWQEKSLKRVKAGRSASCPFTSEHIEAAAVARVSAALADAKSADEVKAAFRRELSL
jgi:SPP1 gp7 family putative phage head morphogenesis protein